MNLRAVYALTSASIAGGLVAGAILLAGPVPSLVADVSNMFIAGALLLFLLLSSGSSVLLALRSKLLVRLAGVVGLLSLITICFWVRRHTNMGIVALGGDSSWVRVAAETDSPDRRRAALETALQGTQYSSNTVETVVLEQYASNPALQAELFETLSIVAPNQGWAERYRARGLRAAASAKKAASP